MLKSEKRCGQAAAAAAARRGRVSVSFEGTFVVVVVVVVVGVGVGERGLKSGFDGFNVFLRERLAFTNE